MVCRLIAPGTARKAIDRRFHPLIVTMPSVKFTCSSSENRAAYCRTLSITYDSSNPTFSRMPRQYLLPAVSVRASGFKQKHTHTHRSRTAGDADNPVAAYCGLEAHLKVQLIHGTHYRI
jgi:hypothetical protein